MQLADGVHEIERPLRAKELGAPEGELLSGAVARVVDDWMSQMARRACSAVDKLTSAVE